MNLPFTPTSFKKFDILQQLVEYESEKGQKTLWSGVKSVLVWAASVHHQHLGSFIGINHVKDALKYSVEKNFISEYERKRLYGSCRHILESLPVYGFAEVGETPDPKQPSIKINREGILAGRVLNETSFLKNTWFKYRSWILLWWIALVLGGVIFLSQFKNALDNLSIVESRPSNQVVRTQFHEHKRFR